jgi:hypothetical protein
MRPRSSPMLDHPHSSGGFTLGASGENSSLPRIATLTTIGNPASADDHRSNLPYALALTVISPVAGVAAVNSVPSPPGLINQPPNVESVFIEALGSPSTVLMEGRAGTVADIPLKDTEHELVYLCPTACRVVVLVAGPASLTLASDAVDCRSNI